MLKPEVMQALQNQVETNNTQETRQRVALEYAHERGDGAAAKAIENALIDEREPDSVGKGHGNAASRRIISRMSDAETARLAEEVEENDEN